MSSFSIGRVTIHEADVVVVGSGFGGSVAALRLTEKGYRVAVLEAGRRFGPEDFARTSWNLRRYLFAPRLGLRGIQRLTLLDDLLVLSGAGVGGGSLVYANTLYEPLDPFYDDTQWAGIADWRAELRPYYELARRMLGAAETPFESEAELVVREVARRMGAEDTFRRATVAVDFERCTRCGGCMVGCRYGAKNTLDRNYLRLAEQAAPSSIPDREARLVRRVAGGWEVETIRSGAWLRRRPERFRAEQVVLAAGALGTVRLLLPLGARRAERGLARPLELGGDRRCSRPRLPDRLLGRDRDRLLVPAAARHPDRAGALPARLEPDGSALDRARRRRRARAAAAALARARRAAPGHVRPQPPRARLGGADGDPARDAGPRQLAARALDRAPAAERAGARRAVAELGAGGERGRPHAAAAMGGLPGSGLNEVFGRPFTAHLLGGAPIGASPGDGVVDPWHASGASRASTSSTAPRSARTRVRTRR